MYGAATAFPRDKAPSDVSTADSNSQVSAEKDAISRRERVMLWFLCAASMVEGADVQLLPASLRAMEQDLALSPFRLATLAICQGVACAIFGPCWANLSDAGAPRRLMLSAGCGAWGLCTLALAAVSDFGAMAVLRTLNGAALAMLLPVTQAYVADISKPSQRGFMFGLMFMFYNLGQVVVCLAVTPISNQDIFGYQGWRVALAAIAVLSLALSPCLFAFVEEEPREWNPELFGPLAEMRKFLGFLKINSFCVVAAQGLFGTIPGASLAFATMYFQYMGIPDLQAGVLFGIYIIGGAIGGFVGGIVGDHLNAKSRAHGRPLTAQLSIVLSLPLVYLMFMSVPREPEMYRTFLGLLFVLGLVSSWAAPGCCRPILSEIVVSQHRASALAWEVALERSCGSLFGPVLVAMLAESVFGYQMASSSVKEMDPAQRIENAQALGEALFFSTLLPWIVCFVLFSMLHFTYAEDAAAQEKGVTMERIASEPSILDPLLLGDISSMKQKG